MNGSNWRVIPPYDNYSVNDKGEIFSHKTHRLIPSRKNKQGHNTVTLTKNKKRKRLRVDRIVLTCFTSFNYNDPYEIIHLDGDNSNDFISNLISNKPTNERRNSKLSESQVKEITEKLKLGYSSRKLAKDYPCSFVTIENINKGKSWVDVTNNPSYPIRKKVIISDRGGESSKSKLTTEKVKEIKRLLIRSFTHKELGKMFKVSESTICNISKGRTWKDV